jgi:hypothetical protein
MLVSACAPPLTISRDGGNVIVNVQTLGEYQTSVARIRLTDAGGAVVWELKARNGAPQLHRIVLTPGANKAKIEDAEYGEYDVVAPKNAGTFVLKPGQVYTIEVWGESGRAAHASFTP